MAATFLPAPRHKYEVHADESLSTLLASAPKHRVPPYGHRQSFVPRAQADFGDGGAFPDIHVAQFPLEMGRPVVKKAATVDGKTGGEGGGVGGISGLGNNSGSTAIVAVDVDENGKVRGTCGIGDGEECRRVACGVDGAVTEGDLRVYVFLQFSRDPRSSGKPSDIWCVEREATSSC